MYLRDIKSLKFILVFLGLPLFGQVDPQWWINNVPAWPLINSNARSECFAGTHVSVSQGSYLAIVTDEISSVCHDTNLDGSLKTGPLTQTYTGAQIFASTFNFLYGTVEFRAKAPSSGGSWPAVWMEATNCQQTYKHSLDNLGGCLFNTAPDYREIDIFESIGNLNATGLSVYNPPGTDQHCTSTVDITQWHVYSLVWSAGSLVLSIDASVSCSITGAIVPAVAMFPIISGQAVVNSTIASPITFLVDYIRISQSGAIVFDDEFNGYSRVLGGALTKQ